ncbi:hypothetical protein [Vibrio penaeicida]|uniref:hypothetical protein n=1 Tax=Vibrio penaeicida TaxID=104609 RepID=UPI000F838C02|nr:hypothetical protein [Vibrio penaeicida]RTZ24613.1 hypothetical protein EKN09_02845 [Vibrio penaeicida]
MLNRHILHKGIDLTNSRAFTFRYLFALLIITAAIKSFNIIAHQQPVVPSLFNLPYNVTYSASFPVMHNNVIVTVESGNRLVIQSRHNNAEWRSELSWKPSVITTRGNCFAVGINEYNPLKVCNEDNVLKLNRNSLNDQFIKIDPHPVDLEFLDHASLYVGGGDYLSMTVIAGNKTLEYSSGLISEALNAMVSLFRACSYSMGIPGLFLSIFIVRSFSFYHDIYQAKLHVYRVLNIPKRAKSWKLAVTTLGVIACTVLIIQTLFHLDFTLPLDTSWVAISFCYAAICFRLYLQGSKLISIEGVALFALITAFSLMKSSIPGYFFHYFGFCSILIGVVRYLASHYYLRTLNRKLNNAEKVH